MTLPGITALLRGQIDVDAALAEFRAGSGALPAADALSDGERFLAYLSDRGLINGSQLSELYAAAGIEVARLLAVKPNGTLVFAAPDAVTLAPNGGPASAATAAVPPSQPGTRYRLLRPPGAAP